MKIFVGSTNPVKINAVIIAASEQWPQVEVAGLEVDSGVSEQPRSDQETKTGAINRAKRALQKGQNKNKPAKAGLENSSLLGVGLEGGVMHDEQGVMWSVVWGAVVDPQGSVFCAKGGGFKVPKIVADKIRQGGEMGPIMSKMFKGRDIRHKEGMIGVITNKFVDRTELYVPLAKTALGLWYGRDWQKTIPLE
jgi:inosine/xanthosine triphosphatase